MKKGVLWRTQKVVDLVRGVTDSLRSKSKLAIRLGQGGTIKDGANAVLAATLAQAETSRRGVRHDVSANRLGAILGKAHAVCEKIKGNNADG